jgi:hypothetical protein
MTTNTEPDGGTNRDELVQRIELMETMIAEGRQATFRNGWIFVLWGLVDLAGVALEWEHPGQVWNWPVTISIGVIIQFIGLGMRRRSGRDCAANTQSRALSAIWGMMGVSLILYCFTANFMHRAGGPAYIAAIFMIIGFAHAASALILRWRMQGAVGALWWGGGLACFFAPWTWFVPIFCIEMLFGMVFFGLYAMLLEHRELDRRTGNA